eukprot:1140742-Pelagomonas_calceolata.AAC.2
MYANKLITARRATENKNTSSSQVMEPASRSCGSGARLSYNHGAGYNAFFGEAHRTWLFTNHGTFLTARTPFVGTSGSSFCKLCHL